MNHHLAILSPGWIELILEGKKTIESRFSKVRSAPFGKVHKGDIVYLKESAGLVKGMFRAERVDTIKNLTYELRIAIDACFREQIFGTPFFTEHYDKWKASKHGTLIHIADPVRFEKPFAYPKKDRRAWVVLDAPLHICEICKDPFLLEVYETPDGELIHGFEHFCPSCYAQEVAD